MDKLLLKAVFNELYLGVDGYLLSDASKDFDKKEIKDGCLTYGEIDFDGFWQMLVDAGLTQNHQVFYDLGSGTGKAVIVAAMSGYFKKVIGIELLSYLFQASEKLAKLFNHKFATHIFKQAPEIIFKQADYLEYDYSDADVVFVQSTCMPDKQFFEMIDKLAGLKKGSIVISITKTIYHPEFKLYESKKYQFGWGQATVNFQVKM